jgi:MtN3 and saliva related transmembrane protein
MNTMDLLGALAGSLTTAAFVPQVVKTWKSRSAGDISLGMLLTFCSGVFLWLLYGLLLGSWPLIAANGVTLSLASVLLVLTLRYRRSARRRQADPGAKTFGAPEAAGPMV